MTNILATISIAIVTNMGPVRINYPEHFSSFNDPRYERTQKVTIIERHKITFLYQGKWVSPVIKEKTLRSFTRRGKLKVAWGEE